MKRVFLALFLFLSLSHIAKSDGLEQYMEVTYSLMGERKTAFISCYIDPPLIEAFLSNSKEFQSYFQSNFEKETSISFYDSLMDYSAFAVNPKLYLPPFEFQKERFKTLPKNYFQKVKLVKIWNRSDYYTQMLTPLELADTMWLANDFVKTYPAGEDVGCRLEVYQFDTSFDIKSEIESILSRYTAEEGFMKEIGSDLIPVFKALQKKKVLP